MNVKREIDWETFSLAMAGLTIFFLLIMFSDEGFAADENSKRFCDAVAEISSELAFAEPEVVKTSLNNLDHWMPVMAMHVIPATAVATRAARAGYSQEYIKLGIFNSCIKKMEGA